MYELKKYDHEINKDGKLVIFNVPIFYCITRNGNVYDGPWLKRAVENAQTRYGIDRYLPPFHIEHNPTNAQNQKIIRKKIGRFLPKKVEMHPVSEEETFWNSELSRWDSKVVLAMKPIMIGDLIIDQKYIQSYSDGEWPWLSVEVGNPRHPEITSMAALSGRPPEFKKEEVTVNPIGPVQFAQNPTTFYFNEGNMINKPGMDQFGPMDLAKKIANNWDRVKVKIMTNPKYHKVMDWLNKDIQKGAGAVYDAGYTSPESLASYLKGLNPQMLSDMASYLFADETEGDQMYEENGMDQDNFLEPNQIEEVDKKINRFIQGIKSPRIKGFLEKVVANLKTTPHTAYPIPALINAIKNDPSPEAQEVIAQMRQFADSEGLGMEDPDQMNCDPDQMGDENPLDQMADDDISKALELVKTASPEQLQQIISMFSGGDPAQMGDDEIIQTPVEQFAQKSKGMTVNQKLDMLVGAVSNLSKDLQATKKQQAQKEIALKNQESLRQAQQFAQKTLSNYPQKSFIMAEVMKAKTPQEVNNVVQFAQKICIADPASPFEITSNIPPERKVKTKLSPELEKLKEEIGEENHELIAQFAAQWETTTKSLPCHRFVRAQIVGYTGNKRNR